MELHVFLSAKIVIMVRNNGQMGSGKRVFIPAPKTRTVDGYMPNSSTSGLFNFSSCFLSARIDWLD